MHDQALVPFNPTTMKENDYQNKHEEEKKQQQKQFLDARC